VMGMYSWYRLKSATLLVDTELKNNIM
jgi:hypothetical protein